MASKSIVDEGVKVAMRDKASTTGLAFPLT
jgi:hypothetical protein